MSPTRILLVDDHEVVLDSLSLMLGALTGVTIVGTCTSVSAALAFLAHQPIDVLITDLQMPGQSGLHLTQQARKLCPSLKILLLTMSDDVRSIREAVRMGAQGYVLKRAKSDELEQAIQTVMAGQTHFSTDVLHLLTDDDTDAANPLTTLTEREIEVIKLIAAEKSSQQIADTLFLSVPTIETHRRHLFQKLNVKSVVGLVRFAFRHGLTS
jgi:DNA-binding NarL/FixJ family response regulator